MIKKLLILLALVLVTIGLVFVLQNDAGDEGSSSFETVATKYKNITFDIESGWDATEQYHVVYPITENNDINQQTKSLIDQQRSDFDSRASETTDFRPDLNVGTEVNFATDDVVLFEIYTTDNTATIIEETVQTRFYNRSTGERYEIDDFFDSDDYAERLSSLSRNTLPDLVDSDTETIEAGTEPVKENFNEFGILSESQMFIDFEPGQVADVSAGIIQMPFEIADVEDILSVDFEDLLFPGYKAEIERQAQEEAENEAKRQALLENTDNSQVPPQSVESVDCQAQKCVALSFDDGPSPSTTPTLVDILDQYNVKATFFMIGSQVGPNADLVKSIADKGHVIGNHTWDHKDLTTLSAADARDEIDRTTTAIENAAGVRPYIVRPPYGAINDKTIQAIGYPTIEWNVDPEDWKNRDVNIVYDRVVTATTSGSVVLSHDIHPTTVEAYKRIVPKLLDEGFTLVTIPQLFGFNADTVQIKNYFSL